MKSFDPTRYINTNPAPLEPEAAYVPTHTFADFKLAAALAANVTAAGIVSPTPIQDQIIGHILEGKDVVGLANTGTGKTAAFLIPLIQLTLADTDRQTLILTPTRELALQIEGELRKLARGMGLFGCVIVGGTPIWPQIKNIKLKNHFVIGTPGRVLDLINRHDFDTTHVTTVVLDEADRMLDMGFVADIRSIIKDIPKERGMLCFSATMQAAVTALIKDFLKNPVTVSVKKQDVTANIVQDVVRCSPAKKFETLRDLLAQPEFTRVLVFGAMKHSVERLSKELTDAGIVADSIHGNKSHVQRQRALKRFKEGQARVLVATDVAARGIHVDGVTHVINYDLPTSYEDYVHRIGRTGRGANAGKALTFVH